MEANKLSATEVRRLYEKHGSALGAYACCCGVDFASAEDVVQQVFLKLLRQGVSAPREPVAYLYRAVRNGSYNQQRNRRHDVELVEHEMCFVHPSGNREKVLSLQKALRELPEEQRETVFLRIWSGMTLQEIADATEVPLNTAASRYRYALEKLRERLVPHFGAVRGKDEEA